MASPDSLYLSRCLQIASLSGTLVKGNPQVGSVIVHKDKIIGEGYHTKWGLPHAEVEAVNSVEDKTLLKESTIYVNLEPCSHFGKTPPCSDLILQHGIPKVVIGTKDPNPKVAGRGITKLTQAGVKVELAHNPEVYQKFNKAFFVNQIHGRAFVTLKWAESSDGFIAPESLKPVSITQAYAKSVAHKLRSQRQAIMVGRRTAEYDNPRLNTRAFYGQHPIRIIVDRKLRLPNELHVFQDHYETLLISEQEREVSKHIHYYHPPQWENLRVWLEDLYKEYNIGSILIEGGTRLLQQFIDQQVFDEIYKFQGKQLLGKGLAGPVLPQNIFWDSETSLRPDKLFYKDMRNWSPG